MIWRKFSSVRVNFRNFHSVQIELFYIFHNIFREIRFRANFKPQFHEFFCEWNFKSNCIILFHDIFREIKCRASYKAQFHEFSREWNFRSSCIIWIYEFFFFFVIWAFYKESNYWFECLAWVWVLYQPPWIGFTVQIKKSSIWRKNWAWCISLL